jgi:hypothetical protein
MFAACRPCAAVSRDVSLVPVTPTLSTYTRRSYSYSPRVCAGRGRHREGTATPRKRPRGKTLFRAFSTWLERARLELSDEPDLGMQLVAELLTHGRLRDRDQLANVLCRRTAEIDQDVRVHV